MSANNRVYNPNPEPFHDPGYVYKVPELTVKWNVCDDTIRRLFRNDPDVIKIPGRPNAGRSKVTLLIPGWVAERTWNSLKNGLRPKWHM